MNRITKLLKQKIEIDRSYRKIETKIKKYLVFSVFRFEPNYVQPYKHSYRGTELARGVANNEVLEFFRKPSMPYAQ